LPLCRRTKMIIKILDKTSNIERAKFIYSPSSVRTFCPLALGKDTIFLGTFLNQAKLSLI
jgi:hypothetical protein